MDVAEYENLSPSVRTYTLRCARLPQTRPVKLSSRASRPQPKRRFVYKTIVFNRCPFGLPRRRAFILFPRRRFARAPAHGRSRRARVPRWSRRDDVVLLARAFRPSREDGSRAGEKHKKDSDGWKIKKTEYKNVV